MRRWATGLLGFLGLLATTTGAGGAVEGRTWTCNAAYKVRAMVDTRSSFASKGAPGYFRFRSDFAGVEFSTVSGSWTLSSPEFDTLGGGMAIAGKRSYHLSGEPPLLEAWIHDRILAETVNWDLDYTGAVLWGTVKANRSETRVYGYCDIFFTGNSTSDVHFGSIRLAFRAIAD